MAAVSQSNDPWHIRHYRVLAALVLLLAAFNLTFRLAAEDVEEWDESLYATSAIEMIDHGRWAATTLEGQLDYYNSKPPLHVWLLVSVFQIFGVGLFSLRIVAATSAWLTVLLLLYWSRRAFGPTVSLTAALVLSTTFGFLHVHAGRSGNPDALLTLVLLGIVLVEWRAERSRSAVVWLGPLLAVVFLLKGAAVLMPLLFVSGVAMRRAARRDFTPGRYVAASVALFLVPIAAWMAMRWQVDGWAFIRLALTQDLATTVETTDGHTGGWFYYLNVIQRYQYDWLVAAAVAAVVLLLRRSRHVPANQTWEPMDARFGILLWWSVVALGVPSLMQTKLPWYVNPLYPAFALGVAVLLNRALAVARGGGAARVVVACALVSLVTAEAKLVWHSMYRRGLEGTVQRLVLDAAPHLRGRLVYSDRWPLADTFVLRGIVGAQSAVAASLDHFLAVSPADGYLVADTAIDDNVLERVGVSGDHALYRRRAFSPSPDGMARTTGGVDALEIQPTRAGPGAPGTGG
jgi:4-amino-4-deoxy-L-arabinose transferase-like glycosyltransferase